MIEITKLTPADVGRSVVYVPRRGKREDGTITSFNASYVFVRFGPSVGGIACDPRDLEWP